MKLITDIAEAWSFLKDGKIIAYPTEAVYGLGCDPFHTKAVEQLLRLKHRDEHKGLIVLISQWDQLKLLTQPLPESLLTKVRTSWPGPVTWIFPKLSTVPDCLSGAHDSIAIRMSAHPIAQKICTHLPVVSTSANLSGKPPARSVEELKQQFHEGIDALLDGRLGGANKPSEIYDVLTGARLR